MPDAKITRREYLWIVSGAAVGLVVGGAGGYWLKQPEIQTVTQTLTQTAVPTVKPFVLPNRVKIGVSYPVSGVSAYEGKHCVDGTLMAVKEINEAGGIGGNCVIDVVVEDDKGDPTEGATIAEKFITQDRVDAIIASFVSPVSLAMAPVAERNKKLFVNANSIAPSLTKQGWAWVFRVCDNSDMMAVGLMDTLVNEIGWKKIVIIAPDDAMGIGSATGIKNLVGKYPGVSVVKEYYVPRGSKDYYPYLTALKDIKPDGMILPLDAMDGAALINQWAELGLRGQVGVCGQGGFEGSEAFLKLTGPNAEGLIDATMFSPFLKPPPNERYTNLINGFRSLYGYLPDKYAVRAYDSIKILAQAIERAQSIDGNSVREALLKTSYTSAIGENLTFDQDHQLHRVELIVQIKNGDHVLIYQKLM